MGTSIRPLRNEASIREVDFKNFNYGECEQGFTSVNLRNGFDSDSKNPHDFSKLRSVQYVDFDGDKSLEALAIVDWSTSGTAGGGTNVYVFQLRNGSPVKIWSKCNERSNATLNGKTIIYTFPDISRTTPTVARPITLQNDTYGREAASYGLRSVGF